jgi:hypothetical protein
MSKFVVDPQSLEALQACVLGLAAELENGPSATAGMQSTYQMGPGITANDGQNFDIAGGQLNGLDGPLDEFLSAWQNSLGQIGGNIERVANALAAAAERYAEVDDHVCLANP